MTSTGGGDELDEARGRARGMAMARSNGWIRDGVGELLEAASRCGRGSVGPAVEPVLICASARGRCWRWSHCDKRGLECENAGPGAARWAWHGSGQWRRYYAQKTCKTGWVAIRRKKGMWAARELAREGLWVFHNLQLFAKRSLSS
jgi:hypothetical protein